MASLRSVHAILRAPNSQARAAASILTARHHISSTTRTYHATPSLRLPYKDDQDRQSLKPRSTEGTKSGTDSEAAQTDAAFDGSKTSPESAQESAEKESSSSESPSGDGNPLETSGANHAKSKPLGNEGGGEMKSTTKGQNDKASGHGSPQKKGKPPGV